MTHSRRIVTFAVIAFHALNLVACGAKETKPAPYALADVVAPAVATLAAQLGQPAQLPVLTTPTGQTMVIVPPPSTPVNADARDRIEGLLGSMASTDAKMRNLAIQDARALTPTEVTECVRILRDEQDSVERRVACARFLGEVHTPESGEGLCGALEASRASAVRAQCAFQLGRVQQDFLLPRMVLRLKYEVDGETVIWLAQACSRYGNLSGVDGLWVLATTARDESVRADALQVGADLAAEFGSNGLAGLRADWFSGALEARRPPVVPSPRLELEVWRRIAKLSVWDLRQVDDARFSLVALDAWIGPHLVSALHDRDTYTRIHTAQVLERRGARARHAVDALIGALREPRTATSAAAALAAIGDAKAVPVLIAAVDSSTSFELRVAAARALGALGSRDAVGSLERAFAPTKPADLRQAAAQSLLALDGGSDALQFLLQTLSTQSGDTVSAEDSIERHLASRTDDGGKASFERWKALDVRVGDIATTAETETRQRARAQLLLAR